LKEMVAVALEAVASAGITVNDLAAFIPHQANLRMVESLASSLKLPPEVAVAREVATEGNTSAASIPLALERMLSSGELPHGGQALLIGFGSGLVHAAQVVTLR